MYNRVSKTGIVMSPLAFYVDRLVEIWKVNDLKMALEYLKDVEVELMQYDLEAKVILECIVNIDPFRERLMRSNGQNADNILLNKMYPMVCPEQGEFVAYKALLSPIIYDDPIKTPIVIATLKIPAYAKRSSAFGRKCKASEALVQSIRAYDYETFEDLGHLQGATSAYDLEFIYWPEKTVKPTETFDEFRWNECSTGIHFFMTFEEALEFGEGLGLRYGGK